MVGSNIDRRRLSPFVFCCLLFAAGTVGTLGSEGTPEPETRSDSSGYAAASDAQSGETVAPVTDVTLFSSGVGHFRRQGVVSGSGVLEFLFESDAMNDLLKSVVLEDLDGGTIRSMNYASMDPVSRALGKFALDLSDNPSLSGMLEQLRGEPVTVVADHTTRGTIVGIESHRADQGRTNIYVTLFSDDGLTRIDLSEVRSVRFDREWLNGEIASALGLLADSHNTDKKRVAVRYAGDGRRRIRIGYLREVPVWKTSYRMVVDGSEGFLQGWALIENTSDEDWTDVSLSLVAGRPVSFIMDLYSPIYVDRPTLSPKVASAPVPPEYQAGARSGAARAPRPEPAPQAAGSYDREESARTTQSSVLLSMDLSAGVSSAAETDEAGELYQYRIATPVSVRRRESVMVPIVNEPVSIEPVSVYNRSVSEVRPMHGLRLSNDTELHLSAGPITVFEDGVYSGDARIDDLQPGDERLISYSVDLTTEVSYESEQAPQRIATAKIAGGTLVVTQRLRHEHTYRIRHAGDEPRTLLIEHPIRTGWDIQSPSPPIEQTRDYYRFQVDLSPGPTAVDFTLTEWRLIDNRIELSSRRLDMIEYYISSPEISAEIREALSTVVDMRSKLSRTEDRAKELMRRVEQIHAEQNRIRSNMEVLDESSTLYERYLSTLSDQEDELTALNEEIDTLKEQVLAQTEKIAEYINGLGVE